MSRISDHHIHIHIMTTLNLAEANQPVHWFLGGKGLGIQQETSVWVASPKSWNLQMGRSQLASYKWTGFVWEITIQVQVFRRIADRLKKESTT